MSEGQILSVEAGEDFIMTPYLERVCQRALVYLEAGYPVHFSGPAGTGKTTLALHLAAQLNRPVMLVYGDEEFGSSDLLGGEKGVVSKRVVDNYIRSVLKTEESVKSQWVDHRLTTACKQGYTLVYDEFSRSHAEANNVLLSIFEERVLTLPERGGTSYLHVHPQFRAIFTSNPDEYAGVYTPQSALLDRMITIKLDHYDRDTEIAIAQAKSGLIREDARKIIDVVRAVRNEISASFKPSLRASIMIGKILRHRKAGVKLDDPVFQETLVDVFSGDGIDNGRMQQILETVFDRRTSSGEGGHDANPSQG